MNRKKPRIKQLYPNDTFRQQRHRPYIVSQCQARYLNESWLMTFEEFCTLWTESAWRLRGRGATDLVMVRRDYSSPWTLANAELVTRTEALRRQGRRKTSKQKGITDGTSNTTKETAHYNIAGSSSGQ